MKIVAEQMNSVLEEMESLKSDTKDAFIELTKTLKTCLSEVKVDNNEKCRILGNTVAKINDKVAKIEKALFKVKKTNIDKQRKAPNSFAEVTGKGNGQKPESKRKKPSESSSAPPSTGSYRPSSSSAPPTTVPSNASKQSGKPAS